MHVQANGNIRQQKQLTGTQQLILDNCRLVVCTSWALIELIAHTNQPAQQNSPSQKLFEINYSQL